MRRLKKIEYIVLHHSWSPDRKTLDYPGIVRYHVEDNGWSDVGYHELIEMYKRRAISINGRPAYYSGAHTWGFNSKAYGICLIGNYNKFAPSAPMWIKCLERAKVICLAYNVPIKKVIGHWETFQMLGKVRTKEEAWKKYKTCPGRKFDMNKFRTGLKNILG